MPDEVMAENEEMGQRKARKQRKRSEKLKMERKNRKLEKMMRRISNAAEQDRKDTAEARKDTAEARKDTAEARKNEAQARKDARKAQKLAARASKDAAEDREALARACRDAAEDREALARACKDAAEDREALKHGQLAAADDRRFLELKLKQQEELLNQYAEDLGRSNLLHKTIVESTVLPIIAAILYKTIYRKGFGQHQQEPRTGANHRAKLLARVNRFADFGMESVAEMRTFAHTWSKVIDDDDRNFAAHNICGDDVIRVLPYATPEIRPILDRGFRLNFGLDPMD